MGIGAEIVLKRQESQTRGAFHHPLTPAFDLVELDQCCWTGDTATSLSKWLVTSGFGNVGEIQTGRLTPGHTGLKGWALESLCLL